MGLNRMTPEELGKLFPVNIVDYDPEWPRIFSDEKKKIAGSAGSEIILEIEHIGSTAVPGLCAKPTIDILLIIKDEADCRLLIINLEKVGYEYIPKPENPPPHMMFAKGYSEKGLTGQTFHIHIRYKGYRDEIIFRDYLVMNPAIASEYAELKRKLAAEFRNDREKYTDSKNDFVKRVCQKTKCKWEKDRNQPGEKPRTD